ncbi:MAG TPA: dihydrofolate reductase family protein [Acidimicrobiales bacterium]|jgi:riboflavin biosynthesis pyrimidine reductase|nr:dihydrofolate reductase family protein [Acidimicrobiales bacterium]
MRQVLPAPIDDVDPFACYGADERPARTERPWLLANMIASLDGATHVDGVSAGLGAPADRRAFRAIRAVADVILVAAGTARSEHYHPITTTTEIAAARAERGQRDRPRLAILTRHLDLDLGGELFTAPEPPIVLTTDHAPAGRLRHAEACTTVLRFTGDRVDVGEAVRALGGTGARVVLSEGGPTLIGQLAAADVLDELCLTVSPLLVGGDAARVTDVDMTMHRRFMLARVLEEDSMLLLRFVRQR